MTAYTASLIEKGKNQERIRLILNLKAKGFTDKEIKDLDFSDVEISYANMHLKKKQALQPTI